MNLIKILSNPVKMQIVQYLATHGPSTTKQISEALSDVPAATLYRHINGLIELKLIAIKEERKVRGSVERLLEIDQKTMNESGSISDMAYQFLMAVYNKFYRYDQKKDKDPVRDHLSLTTAVFMLTDQELEAFVLELGQVYEKYLKLSEAPDETGERKRRSLSMILAPEEDD